MSQAIHTNIVQLTKENFRQEVLENPTPILIDFWAPWCVPCRLMKPVVVNVAAKLEGQVRVAQLNIDDEQEIAHAFNVRSIPNCTLVQEKNVLGAFVGLMSAKTLVGKVLAELPQ